MVSFASRYRMPTSIRKDRPLTKEELQLIVSTRSHRINTIHALNVIHISRP